MVSNYAGDITANDFGDACFTYAESYLTNSGSRPISISLPLEEKTFDAIRTRNFFEGLLPEGFATNRYDRKLSPDNRQLIGLVVPYRLHQEDFSQALGISSSEKYEKNNDRYLKKMFDILRNYSSIPIEDQLKLWDICVFNYLIGNTDNHIKNLSLLYGEDLKTIRQEIRL